MNPETTPPRVLIVDDELSVARVLTGVFESEGFVPTAVHSAAGALDAARAAVHDVTLLDLKLPDADGLTILRELRALHPEMPIVVISGHGTIKTAVEAVKLGAYDFLEKPLDRDQILITVGNALEKCQLARKLTRLEAQVYERYKMVGASAAMQAVYTLIDRAAPSRVPVMIAGETGVGKELAARAIHRQSQRADEAFVKINCAAVPEPLLESELFGHEKGAFTGAYAAKQGRLELADHGTVLLDEVGDMTLATQSKVLRFLQDGELERVGGNRVLKLDVRVIAATNKNLKEEVTRRTFREDLFFRLNVIEIFIPPLRERREDIGPLCDHFLGIYCRDEGVTGKALQPDALTYLESLPWPGNVRELENLMRRCTVLVKSEQISAAELIPLAQVPSSIRTPLGEDFREARARIETELILSALGQHQGDIARAARALGLDRTYLYRKMKKLGIQHQKKSRL